MSFSPRADADSTERKEGNEEEEEEDKGGNDERKIEREVRSSWTEPAEREKRTPREHLGEEDEEKTKEKKERGSILAMSSPVKRRFTAESLDEEMNGDDYSNSSSKGEKKEKKKKKKKKKKV